VVDALIESVRDNVCELFYVHYRDFAIGYSKADPTDDCSYQCRLGSRPYDIDRLILDRMPVCYPTVGDAVSAIDDAYRAQEALEGRVDEFKAAEVARMMGDARRD